MVKTGGTAADPVCKLTEGITAVRDGIFGICRELCHGAGIALRHKEGVIAKALQSAGVQSDAAIHRTAEVSNFPAVFRE